MRLEITTPLAVIVAEDQVRSVRAEDASGSFGILPGHADFLTSLTVSVVSWRGMDGALHHCAVRRGVLSVTQGRQILIATREAVTGDDLTLLHENVLRRFLADIDTQRKEHVEATRLQLVAIRQIMRHLQSVRNAGSIGSTESGGLG